MAKIFIGGDVVNMFSDVQFIDTAIEDIIKSADIAICNLEGPIVFDNEINNLRVYQKRNTIKHLKDVGINVLLLANNHITDGKSQYLLNTINEIKRNGVDYLGAGFNQDEIYKPFRKIVNGKTICIINVCEAQEGHFQHYNQEYGYAWLGFDGLESLIAETRKSVDVLLVCVHAGLEHFELPLKEYRDLYRRYCDLGANCVVGTHPHIAQGIEHYKNSIIFYSLGNFYFPRSIASSNNILENWSYSILLDFSGDQVAYTPIFHYIKDLKVNLSSKFEAKSFVDLQYLSDMLIEPQYYQRIHEIYNNAYNTLCGRFLKRSLMGTCYEDDVLTSVKFVIRYLFFRKKYWLTTEMDRNKMLLRQFENETYRYVILHVLRNKYSKI